MKRLLLAAPMVALATVGCDDHLIGVASESSFVCSHEPPLTYENFGEGFLRQHCAGCHSDEKRDELREGAPLGVDYNSWQALVAGTNAERALVRTVELQSMPPGGGPSQEDRELFGEWLACEVIPVAGTGGGEE